jgi:hypothetical protein
MATYPANADLYRRVRFIPPWVSYVAVDDGRAVGGGAFVGPPRDNPSIVISGFALRESSASTKILQRLSFKLFGDAEDPDAGDVWEWRT